MNTDDLEGHTPGPWKWSKEQLSEYVPQPKALLCVFEGVELPVINMKSRYIGNDANKALIAAAPDLLAEVKRLRALIWSLCYPLSVQGRLSVMEYADMSSEADAVIKAGLEGMTLEEIREEIREEMESDDE